MNNNEIILFETEDRMISLPVMVKDETVWLNRNQLSELFERDIKTIGKHINNTLKKNYLGKIQLSQNLRQLLPMEKNIW